MIKKLKGIEFLKEKIKHVSKKAGVYRMLDETGKVLYVGKAKNLQKRLTNYTQPERLSHRIKQMVSETSDLIVIETAGETEAFLLENDLIKKYHPFYNVLLKDDKSYPYIVITSEKYPKLIKYRGSRKLKGTYFGPFASGLAVKQTLTELQKIFGLRVCSDSYFKNRTRPCLLYQIKRCLGPCCHCVSDEIYQKSVQDAKSFMKGENQEIQLRLKKEMEELSLKMEYEQAALIRDKILALNHIQNTDAEIVIKHTDLIAFYVDGTRAGIEVFFYRGGRAEGNVFHLLNDIDEESPEESLASFLLQFYDTVLPPKYVLLSCKVPKGLEEALSQKTGTVIHVEEAPTRGAKHKLMTQALKNAKHAFERELNEKDINEQAWEELRKLLEIETLETVEIYDNSHIQGASAVGACVSASVRGFEKKNYRRFNIDGTMAKTNDDFGMMKEVMYRRLTRGVKENNLPSAMLIDGGKGQLSSVLEIMNELKIKNIAVLAVAKGEERNKGKETLFLGTRPNEEIHLDLKSDLIHLIQRLRDEAHRFAIGSHRKRRAQNMFHESILDIEGVGAKRKKDLLAYFGSAKAIAGASLEQIMKVDGISEKIAKKIYTFYHD